MASKFHLLAVDLSFFTHSTCPYQVISCFLGLVYEMERKDTAGTLHRIRFINQSHSLMEAYRIRPVSFHGMGD